MSERRMVLLKPRCSGKSAAQTLVNKLIADGTVGLSVSENGLRVISFDEMRETENAETRQRCQTSRRGKRSD